jgi:protein O-GlcNAc transferase
MTEITFSEAMDQATEALNTGQTEVAVVALETAIKIDPTSTPAHFQLGSVFYSLTRFEEARVCFRETARLAPDLPESQQNLGHACEALEMFEEALQAYHEAGRLAPEWAEPRLSEGRMLVGAGRNKEAIEPLKKAVELAPEDWRPPFYLGNAWLHNADPESAVTSLALASSLEGAGAEVFNNYGRTLEMTGQRQKALPAYLQARQLDPEHFRAALNLGNYYARDRQLAKAEENYRDAIRMRPNNSEGYAGLGDLLHTQHRYDEAIEAMLKAVSITDDDAELINYLAFSLSVQGRYAEASKWYDRLIELDPERAPAYVNYASMFEMMEKPDEALLMLRQAASVAPDYSPTYPLLAHAKLRQCNWENLDSLITRVTNDARNEIAEGLPLSAQPFALLALPVPLDIRLAASRQMAEAAKNRVLSENEASPWQHKSRGEKSILKIGYISPDFRSHSVGICFQDLLAAHDRSRFEVFGYHIARKSDDDLTDYYRGAFDRFVDLRNLSPFDAAQKIHDDGIDILIDLAGHTGNSRYEVLALKPAPVQVHFLGYGATTGADYVDYLITDDAVMPPEAAQYCSETLTYIPHTFMPASRYDTPEIQVFRADEGLPENGFVFANFNAHYKFDPEVFSIWMRMLKRTPGSVLWLVSGTDRSNQNLKNEARSRGVDPDRIVIAKRCGHSAHLARHKLADLGLDNYFHAGGVTTIDALWAGLPVLTMRGPYPNSRTGVGIVEAAGLPELIADDRDHYSRLALDLAASPQRLKELRKRLNDNRLKVPLFDMAAFAVNLEQAYEQMWTAFEAGDQPTVIHIRSDETP